MAGVNLQYQIKDEAVEQALRELNRRARDMRPAFQAIGDRLDLSHRERFDKQVSPQGVPWVPLSPEYKAKKKRRKDEILVLNAFLRDTLRSQPARDHLRFGTDRPYGAAHHFGYGPGGIPARPWLGTSDADEAAAQRILLTYLGRPLGARP